MKSSENSTEAREPFKCSVLRQDTAMFTESHEIDYKEWSQFPSSGFLAMTETFKIEKFLSDLRSVV